MMENSACEVAVVLNNYMRDAGPQPDNAHILRIMDRLCDAPVSTPLDALVMTVWTDNFIAAALAQLPVDDAGSTDGARFILGLARVMARKAITALENTTDAAAESFDCSFPTRN